jgi:hypothetical protein
VGEEKMKALQTIHLKTRSITFDDRLQQVRVVQKGRKKIEFHSYTDARGWFYIKKYKRGSVLMI